MKNIKVGDKVRFIGGNPKNRYQSLNNDGNKYLKVGEVYTVRTVDESVIEVNEEGIREYFLTTRQRYRIYNDKKDSFVKRHIWTMLLSKDRYRYGICRRLAGTKLSRIMKNKSK